MSSRTDVSDLARSGILAEELGAALASAPPVDLEAVRARKGRGRMKPATDPDLAALQAEAGLVAPAPPPEPARLDLEAEEAQHGDAWPLDRRGPHPATLRQLALTKEGFPRPCLSNAILILQKDPRWSSLRCNAMTEGYEMDGGTPVPAALVGRVAVWLSTHYGLHLGAAPIDQAIAAVAQERLFSPVREYLDGLVWDGERRIERLAAEVLGLEPSPLHQLYLRRFLVSAVARALSPGCKVDTALVLVGAQGARKSSFFRILFSDRWFGDSPIPIGDKDAPIQLRAVWGYEAAEMEDLSKRTAEAVKQFLSTNIDLYRGLYERGARARPRHSVMIGTTNREQFLSDETGHRRFWPLTIPESSIIRLDTLRAWRDQLWAEARVLYIHAQEAIDAGQTPGPDCRWWFERDEDVERAGDVSRYVEAHPWEDLIRAWLPRMLFTTQDVLSECLHLDAHQQNQGAARMVSKILIGMGFESRAHRLAGGVSVRRWVRAGSADEAREVPM